MKLKYKIALLISLLLILLIFINAQQLRSTIEPAVKKSILEKLTVASVTFQTFWRSRQTLLVTLCRGLVEDSRLKAGLATHDVPTVEELLTEKMGEIGADFMSLCQFKENRLQPMVEFHRHRYFPSRLEKPGKFPVTVNLDKLFDLSLEGDPTGTIFYQGRLIQTASVAVTQGKDEVIGLLTLGFALDQKLMNQLNEMTKAENILAADDRVSAFVFPPLEEDQDKNSFLKFLEIRQSLLSKSEDPAGEEAADRAWRETEKKIGDFIFSQLDRRLVGVIGWTVDQSQERWIYWREAVPTLESMEHHVPSIYFLQNFDRSLTFLELVNLSLRKTGFLVVAVGILLGFLFSNSVTRPLGLLCDSMKRVLQGDYDFQVKIATRDELHDLGDEFNTMVRGLKERQTMSKFVSQSALREIQKIHETDGGKLVMGGHRARVSILFSDIRSFTTIAEKQSPEETVAMLNDYFEKMNRVVLEHGGDIDKFIGDAIMAVFPSPDPALGALNAAKAALAMLEILTAHNQARVRAGKIPIEIGVGINTGEVIEGNLGSTRRMEHTIIGDAVNLASRLEGMSKLGMHTKIIVSEFTKSYLQDSFEFQKLEAQRVKGKEELVEMFEIIGPLA